MIDLVKNILPLVTFILGMAFTPFAESLKIRAKANSLNKTILNEINDEYFILQESIITLDKSIKERAYKPISFIHLSLPRSFNLIMLEKNLSEAYFVLNKEFRIGYKALLTLQGSIIGNREQIIENFKTDNSKCRALEKSMQFSMLSAYYIMNKMLTNEENFVFPTIDNVDIVKFAAESLKVAYPLD